MPANTLSFIAREGLHNVTVHLFRRRLPDGPLWYRFWLGGKKYSASTGHAIERDARSIARDKVVKAIAQSALKSSVPRTLGSCIQAYIDSMPADYSASHRRGAATRLNRFAAAVGADLRLDAVSADALSSRISAFIEQRGLTLKALTLRNDRVMISGFCAWLMLKREPDGAKWVSWAYNPASAQHVKTPKVERRIKPLIQEADVNALIRAAQHTELLPVVVLMLSGCRPIGVSRLLWKDVDLKKRVVWVKEKNESVPMPLSKWAAGKLEHWRRTRKPEPQPDDILAGTTREGMDKALKYLRLANGLPRTITWGALRRLVDFRLYKAGVSTQAAGAQMRHSPETAQRHYVEWKLLTSHEVADVLSFEPAAQAKPRKTGTKSGTRTGTRSRKAL
ncbi:MAG: site-specific integrase [Planctomycetes bacterium]|nr:site-specific integrase [Planctomycetota bacterium]